MVSIVSDPNICFYRYAQIGPVLLWIRLVSLEGYWRDGIHFFSSLFAYSTYAGILLEGRMRDLNFPLQILNVYGPYSGREYFWKNIELSGILVEKNLILVGDLNLTLASNEVWCFSIRSDPLANFFLDLFIKSNLVDIPPVPFRPI